MASKLKGHESKARMAQKIDLWYELLYEFLDKQFWNMSSSDHHDRFLPFHRHKMNRYVSEEHFHLGGSYMLSVCWVFFTRNWSS